MTNLHVPREIAGSDVAATRIAPRRWPFARRMLDGLYFLSALSGALAILAVLALMLLQVAYRQSGFFLRGANELTAWCCAAAVFLPLAYTFKAGELIRMGLMLNSFHGAKRRMLEILSLATASAFITYAAYWAVRLSYESWLIGERAQGMIAAPMWIPQSSVSIGLVVLVVAMVDELLAVLRGGEPTYDAAARERRERCDFSADL